MLAATTFAKFIKRHLHTEESGPQEQTRTRRSAQTQAPRSSSSNDRHIQPQTANSPKATIQQEVRQALADANKNLSNVFQAVLFDEENDVTQRLNELVNTLKPLGTKLAQEAGRGKGNPIDDASKAKEAQKALEGKAMFNVVARLVRERVCGVEPSPGMQPKELEVLSNRLQKLEKPAPEGDGRIDFLAYAVRAAQLMQQADAVESGGTKFQGTQNLDLSNHDLAELRELSELKGLADKVDGYFDNSRAQGKWLPGTKLTPARLKAIQTMGSAADNAISKRAQQLTSDLRAALGRKLQRSELMKLDEALKDWLAAFPSDDNLKGAKKTIDARLKALDDKITKDVIGSADVPNLQKMTEQELVKLRNKIAKRQYLPPALVHAKGVVEGVIAQRKTAAEHKARDEFQSSLLATTVRLKVEQIQLVNGVGHIGLGRVGLQGA
ncbi:hypothetical protein [Hydrogenophaga sp. BPS33]|uniref:hypothetical protein n=1 Tax=Hydrogenophaga sp. BPS33 TaxID=2651974 RepID=UPI00131F4B66|nr:hypothetical protein [Hydrogenophaga sp. BPS33]QHE86921.1 hypothetical protein F9K07_19455 [Hydrogenophaga sp. BPS33]